MRVKVSGLKEIDKALGDLPNAVGKRVLRKVGADVLEPMASKARMLSPDRTGKLDLSITVSEKRTRRAKTNFRARQGIQLAMGPSGPGGALMYASFVEFGTVDTPAFGYMRGAWDAHAATSLDNIKDQLWAEINKAVGRQARRAAKRAA